ncbi:polyprenyl synthetase family protein [Streptococcus castoreus]|uniref:polyprenyl synthetase family protein n=1 Tax=Streptococcus castoreus TaxID=254786 RepID=UPI0031330982
MHLATLIHDDIIDDSPLRCGHQTAQSQFGKILLFIAVTSSSPFSKKVSLPIMLVSH